MEHPPLSRGSGRLTGGVWTMAVGRSVRASHWSLRGGCLCLGHENGMLRCPAGASLYLSAHPRVKMPSHSVLSTSPSERIVSHVRCGISAWRKAAKGDRARSVSAVRRLLPPPAEVSRKPVVLGAMRWVDVAGRALRRTWTARLPSAIC